MDLNNVVSSNSISSKKYRQGQTNDAVEIETIHLPLFCIPKYKSVSTGQDAILACLVKVVIIVPLTMLSEQVNSPSVRDIPASTAVVPPNERVSQPTSSIPIIAAIAADTIAAPTKGREINGGFFDAVPIENLSF